jgi:signal transduction histidine kinase/DNA-binding response OmpR family regulator/ligand-binding sensor domain-containing protein
LKAKYIQQSLFYILCISIFLPLSGQGQNTYIADVQHFSVENGLSHRQVITTFQDTEGFIWIGTKYGLNRFDGHDWLIFTKEKHGLADNTINQIVEDDEGWLWIMHHGQLGLKAISFLHTQTFEVLTFEERFGKSGLSEKDAFGIKGEEDKAIYISAKDMMWTYQNGQWLSKTIPNIGNYYPYHQNKKGEWIVQKITGNTSQLIVLKKDGQQKVIKTFDSVYKVFYFEDNQGATWFRYDNNLSRKLRNEENFQLFDVAEELSIPFVKEQLDYTSHLFGKNQDVLWYKNEKEFFVFTPDNKIVFDFKKEYPQIIEDYINNIFNDRQGNTWVITDFGIYKIRLSPTRFKNYLSLPIRQYNVKEGQSIRGIHFNNNQLWVNTVTEKDYIINTTTDVARPLVKNKPSITDDHLFRPVLHLKEQEYLTFSEELVHYKEEQPIANYIWKKNIPTTFAWSLHQDKQQNIWIGTYEKGLAIIDGDSLAYYDRYNGFKELQKSSIYHFLQWDEEHILLSSNSGIYVFHHQKGIIQRFSTDSPDDQKLYFDKLYHLHQDLENPNILWAATDGGGMLRLELDSKNWHIKEQKQITIIDGLSNNVTYAIYEDQQQNLWISSDLGINRYNKTTAQIQTYTTQDGLPFNEFNKTAHHQAADGRLFFGSMNGVAAFYPNEFSEAKEDVQPILRLTALQQFIGNKNELQDLTNRFRKTKKIVLAPNDKFLNLQFALLEYRDAHQIKYSYQLSGQGDEWIYLNENELRLSGLPYGNTILKIRAQGLTTPTGGTILEIPIRALKPIYLRWWFMIVSFIVAILGVFYFFKRRTQQLEKRQAELKALVKERTQKIEEDKATIEKDKTIIEQQANELRNLDQMKSKFFANISHELRTPLTLMLAPIDNTLKENQLTNRAYTNLLLAKKNGQRLHRMINEILDLTKLEAGKLEVQTQRTVLYSFVKNIVASFESIANQKEIDFIFDYQGNKYLQVFIDQRKVEIILLNLLSNAFKFTPNSGKVALTVTDEGQFLQFQVSDTGQGIHPEDMPNIFNRFYQSKDATTQRLNGGGGTGIGLALTKEFVELLKGTINVESELLKNTIFTIQIPKKELISQVTDEAAMLIKNEVVTTNNQLEQYKEKTPIATNQAKDTILLVEDNHDLRFFIKSILSTEYNVITAENGKVGLERLTDASLDGGRTLRLTEKKIPIQDRKAKRPSTVRRLPSLIISDIMMPIMDGYEFVEKVKSDERFNHIPIIVLTARAALEDKMKALRIGVDDYLNKPFIEEELFVRIENLLRNAKNRKAIIEEAIVEKEATPAPKAKQTTLKTITPEMQTWLAEVEALLLEKIENNDYTIDQLATDMAISKRQLARRIKEIVGITPSQYIKTIRYTKARELLENKTYTSVKAVAYSVGFKDVVNFSRQFRKRFGKFPSEYL